MCKEMIELINCIRITKHFFVFWAESPSPINEEGAGLRVDEEFFGGAEESKMSNSKHETHNYKVFPPFF